MTNGASEIFAGLDGFAGGVSGAMAGRMAVVAGALAGWARTEHPWHSRSGHTEASITAFLEEEQLDAQRLTVVLQADQDAALWLELAHGGRWAWMWGVMMRHRGEIMAMLGGEDSG
jgi:hypothetical protein